MTLPITGPFTQSYGIDDAKAGSYFVQKTGYKQGRPYDRPLQYDFHRADTLTAVAYNGWPISLFANQYSRAAPRKHNPYVLIEALPASAESQRLEALEKARSRCLDTLGDPSALLTLMAEYQSNLDFIADAAMYIRDFVKVRKGILRPPRTTKGGRILRKPRESITKHLPTKKEIASDYLAIQFVVLPTISDVDNAMNTLERPIPDIKGKGTSTRNAILEEVDEGYSYRQRSVHTATFRARVEASFRISNPNLFLANRLGLINLPLTAYEVSPWSFVLDYFVNVSAWLGQFTETAGVDLVNAYYTQSIRDKVNYRQHVRAYPWLPYDVFVQHVTSESVSMQRRLGIPDVTLRVRAPWRLSTTRASTSVALLLQMLRS